MGSIRLAKLRSIYYRVMNLNEVKAKGTNGWYSTRIFADSQMHQQSRSATLEGRFEGFPEVFFHKIWTRISLLMLESAQQSTVWWMMPNLWRKSSLKKAGCSAFSKEKTQPAFYLCCYRVLPFLFPNHCPDFQSIFLSNLSFPSFFGSLDALFLSSLYLSLQIFPLAVH